MTSDITEGMLFRHFSGRLYTVLAVGMDEPSLRPVVIYRSVDDGRVWVRTVENFCSEVMITGCPTPVSRFSREMS